MVDAIAISRASCVVQAQSGSMDAVITCGGMLLVDANSSTNISCPDSFIAKRLIAGLSYLLLSTFGALLYFVFLGALWRNRQYYSKHSFYVVVWHLAIGDMGIIVTQFFVAVPLSLAGYNVYGSTTVLHALAAMDTVFFRSIWLSTGWIALNRCSYFIWPKIYRLLFTKPQVHFTMATSWLLSAFYLVFYYYEECFKTFDAEGFYYKYDCPTTPKSPTIHSAIYCLNASLPIAYMLLYLCVFAKIRAQRKNCTVARNRKKLERNLLIQGFLICAVLSTEVGLFAIPRFTDQLNMSTYAVALTVTWIVIINSMINPVIFFLFNRQIRQDLLLLVCLRSSHATPEGSIRIPMMSSVF